MYFFNLSLFEFLGLLGAASAVVVTLYLLNRSRTKQVVATLRFWRVAEQPVLAKHRKRIQQPWSLILQLLSIAMLLLAIAQLRLGSKDQSSRDHIVVLDTSSWMAAEGPKGALMDEAKDLARRYVRALPPADRVMLVRADGLAAPATRLDTDREIFDRELLASRPSGAGLNLSQALQFASQVQKLHASREGEIVFVGAGRVSREDTSASGAIERRMRILPVSGDLPNAGLRKLAMRRSLADPEIWEIFVAARNYGSATREIPLALTFGGAVVAGSRITLPPQKDAETTFRFRTKAAGWLEARLMTNDALPEDNRVFVELPSLKPLRVAVYTDDPVSLRPVIDSNRQVQATYTATSAFGKPFPKGSEPAIYVFDRFVPRSMPAAGAVFIQPPDASSPFRIRTTTYNAPIARWLAEHSLATGLRSKELKLDEAQVFAPQQGDLSVAEVAGGPVVVARPGERRMVVIGFHPGRSSLRFDLATPLLFANLLRWMEPEAFRRWELNAASVGAVTVPLESAADARSIKVFSEGNTELPHTVSGNSVGFYSGSPGTVRVVSENREQVYSLTLPDIGDEVWTPPANALRGVPAKAFGAYSRDIWHWLALLGALGFVAEWLLYGRTRPILRRAAGDETASPLRRAS